jgi:hypothetical protein
MKLKLPLILPRTRPKSAEVNTYTQHITTTKRTSTWLLVLLALLVGSLIFFSPQITNYITSLNRKSTSISSSSASSVAPRVISFANSYNQQCVVTMSSTIPVNQYTPKQSNQLEAWYKPGICSIPGLTAIRAINTANVIDPSASTSYSPPNTNLTLLAYSSTSDVIMQATLIRYQLSFAEGIANTVTIFDPTKSTAIYQNGNLLYYLDMACNTASKECGLWRQDRITTSVEKLLTVDTSIIPIKFSQFQKNGTLALLQKITLDSTQVTLIDEADPTIILRKTYLNTDSALDIYVTR